MFESTLSFLVAAGILVVLALFVPCMESLARLFRRKARTSDAEVAEQSEDASTRRVA